MVNIIKGIIAVIGSRETPQYQLSITATLVKLLSDNGFQVRSGGTKGMDNIATQWAKLLECYLPADGFKPFGKDNKIKLCAADSGKGRNFIPFDQQPLVQQLAAYHLAGIIEKELSQFKADISIKNGMKPFNYTAFDELKPFVQKLKARNMWQILGPNLDKPVTMVITWTQNGQFKGGTGTALWLAVKNNIPIVNLGTKDGMEWAKKQFAKAGIEFPAAPQVKATQTKPTGPKFLMKDLWETITSRKPKLVCVTSNMVENIKSGKATLGAGAAKDFVKMLPEAPALLGQSMRDVGKVLRQAKDKHGNTVNIHEPRMMRVYKTAKGTNFFSFPVKYAWWEKADLGIIEQSCKQLMLLMDKFNIEEAILNFPGIGNGKLKVEEVKPILDKYLDNRVIICHRHPLSKKVTPATETTPEEINKVMDEMLPDLNKITAEVEAEMTPTKK